MSAKGRADGQLYDGHVGPLTCLNAFSHLLPIKLDPFCCRTNRQNRSGVNLTVTIISWEEVKCILFQFYGHQCVIYVSVLTGWINTHHQLITKAQVSQLLSDRQQWYQSIYLDIPQLYLRNSKHTQYYYLSYNLVNIPLTSESSVMVT